MKPPTRSAPRPSAKAPTGIIGLDDITTKECLSSGIRRLADTLGGGFYRGRSVLVTGLPGTAKTTLGGTFAQAARQRGETISTLSKARNQNVARGVAERLLDWAKSERITVLLTSLLDNASFNAEVTPIRISTIADTWVHLNYLVQSGENRGQSIVKSRGTFHTNQVRELILSSSGVTPADACTAGGEVLVGTLRWEKEMGRRMELSETASRRSGSDKSFDRARGAGSAAPGGPARTRCQAKRKGDADRDRLHARVGSVAKLAPAKGISRRAGKILTQVVDHD